MCFEEACATTTVIAQPGALTRQPFLLAAQVRKDLERLEMLKAKREADRQARIKAEGWDRFAPVTETNKPPAGHHRPPRDSDEDDD